MTLSSAVLFMIGKGQKVTGLAIECSTYFFQRDEIDSQCLIFLQAPQRRMTYPRFFRQPIERPRVPFK
jgi:hypothetical protein